MDVEDISKELRKFGSDHAQILANFPQRETQLLELAAMTLAAIHYERHGYAVTPSNLNDSGEFRMKLSTRGRPENFSWWSVIRATGSFEIHANLPIVSNYNDDDGTYVVDVAVIPQGRLDSMRSFDNGRRGLPNDLLVTFAEVKKLVVYPMLLAQFVGIVHEIQPRFLGGRRPYGFLIAEHFDPALITIGYLHNTSKKIVSSYSDRGFRVSVVTNCDGHLSRLQHDPAHPSPLDRGRSLRGATLA